MMFIFLNWLKIKSFFGVKVNISYSVFLKLLDDETQKIKSIWISSANDLLIIFLGNSIYKVEISPVIFSNSNLLEKIYMKTEDVQFKNLEIGFFAWLKSIAFIGLCFYFLTTIYLPKQSQFKEQKDKICMEDVAGMLEVKKELVKIIDFIKNSEKYKKLGCHIPKGILFYGPPGAGKTLLAKAIASEADCNFLYSSGSDFIEMWVGVGASRIRELFTKAKQSLKPTIIFIDEIDSIAGKRNQEIGCQEQRRTLNALLTEMDGFISSNVIVIAATNTIQGLDPAILRAGRFDYKVYIGLPYEKERFDILKVHFKFIPVDKSVNLELIAKKTAGFSGADLKTLANEAALIAASENANYVTHAMIIQAYERVTLGFENKSMVISKEELEKTAYHEAGHAIVSYVLYKMGLYKNAIEKITISPRSNGVLGLVYHDKSEKDLQTKTTLFSFIKICLAGSASEQLVFGKENLTIGASSDYKQATEIAVKMVTKFGMSDLGYVSLDQNNISDLTKFEVERLAKTSIEEAFEFAFKILEKNRKLLDLLAKKLIEQSTLTLQDLEDLIKLNNIQIFLIN